MQLTFVCLSIAAFIASAHAEIIASGDCPKVPAQANLNVQEFIKPLWYDYSGYPNIAFKMGTCITIQYKALGGDKYTRTKTEIRNGKPLQSREDVKYVGGGKFHFDNPPQKQKFQVNDYIILATDYKNYAIGYSCVAKEGQHSTNLVLQTSVPNPTPQIVKEAEGKISALGLSVKDMKVTDKTGCK